MSLYHCYSQHGGPPQIYCSIEFLNGSEPSILPNFIMKGVFIKMVAKKDIDIQMAFIHRHSSILRLDLF